MDSLDAGEGTHIIFSTSVGALRRQPEDLTAFESTVFDHLGLKHPRAILSHLRAFIEGQEEEEESLDRSVSDARRQIDDRREDLERRRGQILASWGPSPPPSRPETKKRVQQLIEKIKPEEAVRELSLESLVDEAESALEERTNAGREPLDHELQQLGAKLDRLTLIEAADQELGDRERDLSAAEKSLVVALDGASMDELRQRVRSEGQQLETSHLRHKLGSIALEFLKRQDSEGSTLCPCPVCGVEHGQEELRDAMSGMTCPDGEVEDSGLRVLEARLKEAMRVEGEVQELAREVEEARAALDEMIAGEPDEKLRKAISEDRAAACRQSTCERHKSVEAQVTDLDNWLREVRTDLRKLRDEAEYHAIQRSLRDLGAVDAEMQGVQKAYNSLVTFGQSTRDICDAVESTLTETLREKMPSVSAALTSAFRL